MMSYLGLPIAKGIAHNKIYKIEDLVITFDESSASDVEKELEIFKNGRMGAIADVEKIYEKTLTTLGENEARIFEAHLSLLNDIELISQVEAYIKDNRAHAAYAVSEVSKQLEAIFTAMDNEYMRDRAADIKDITTRIIKHIKGIKTDNKVEEECIVMANDLTPSMTSSLDKNLVKGIITETGGKTSHSAIIANLLEIPYIVLDRCMSLINQGDIVVFDGADGSVHVDPDEKTTAEYRKRQEEYETLKNKYKELEGLPAATKDGEKVELMANIGNTEDMEFVVKSEAKSIGLFRTEFLFMDDEYPDEEKQFKIYKEVAEKLPEGYVTIRTIDIGGDKNSPHFDIAAEDNPFLGYRGIRLCLGETEIFKAQLRAILRAGVYGSIKIMFPMIATVQEFMDAKELIEECKKELRSESIEFNDNIPVGIMVETPAAAIMADAFAKLVDFFSIGTNDLVQYTLAADRMNKQVSYMYSAYDPAVIRSIGMVAQAAKINNIPVSICGESAADKTLLPVFVGLGIRHLSMSVSFMPEVKWALHLRSLAEDEAIRDEVFGLYNKDDIKEYLKKVSEMLHI
ncbi:phosphotransferase system, enzyme I, PtsI [Dethiosulfatibacter aminovorans DSM 17477]|uniref:Phosphoenolpyruvate-protein phosphotransferase n=1 Tax=Dethiosulfatibacter aminovorans DSM 17477 TaxID=1121476 RepID=A0A1M6GCK3_9FIRM|nr:phosphoenolpyruvate--protein phosphotransferase [Dethiosulfatibacter aminovorans]SHJ07636.1 phosphotransferase system, enzyme I, PtsI [Dethiosulfatibacter aminovorans DSM 17477]